MTASEILTRGELVARVRLRGLGAQPHHVVNMNDRGLFQPPAVRTGHVLAYSAAHVDQLAAFVAAIEAKQLAQRERRAQQAAG